MNGSKEREGKMTKIQIMPPTLANQIAAGEVIERPASVVKELVENAIDAESTQIDVKVEEAGLKRIQVIDNGEGIPFDEVEQAFERHATSKLLSNEELFRIRSLGFRGEALPSIASVSELTIETAEENEVGKHLELKGGMIESSQSAPSRKGTKIKVENLFFNTPARLKYVKTLQTELSHISDTLNRLALAHPEISFRLTSDGTNQLKTPGNGDVRQAVAGIYGVETAKKMKPIEQKNFDFSVSGYVSLPELTRSNNNYITLIVNGRHIKNYALNKAIVNGYGSKLMVGRYPIAVVNIEMDPLLLDVNVHPTKQQIRISNEKELGKLIEEAITERMNQETRIPSALENMNSGRKALEPKVEQTKINFGKPQEQLTPKEEQSEEGSEQTDSYIVQEEAFTHSFERNSQQAKKNSEENEVPSNQYKKTKMVSHDVSHVDESPLKTAEKTLEETEETKEFPELEYVGQMHGTYLFAQNEEGLTIIDQHAAQERIKYEYYRGVIDQTGTASQELLIPIVLDYPSNEAMIIRENKEKLESAGINIEEFGQNSFRVRQHPAWMKAGQEENTIKEMIDFLLETKELSVAKFREATAIMMSCKRSIKANHYLNPHEARKLLEDLRKTKNPFNCPHGRPVMVRFSTNEMEKMFKRIQDPH